MSPSIIAQEIWYIFSGMLVPKSMADIKRADDLEKFNRCCFTIVLSKQVK